MITPAQTPVEVWAPAFAWEPEHRLFKVERLLTLQRQGGRYCLLCEGTVSFAESKKHVRHHRTELHHFQRDGAKRREREAARVLRESNRLLAENRRLDQRLEAAAA